MVCWVEGRGRVRLGTVNEDTIRVMLGARSSVKLYKIKILVFRVCTRRNNTCKRISGTKDAYHR